MAAVLACGPDASLSHRSAAALWGIAPAAGSLIDVSTGRRGLAVKPGIALHHVRYLPAGYCTKRHGIPVTSVGRTLLDLAEVLDPTRLGRSFEEAERLQLLDLRPLQEMLRRSRGRRGLGTMRRLVAAQAGPPDTRSELERRFLDLCRDAELPQPQINQRVLGFEVDAYWPSAKLVVELDGFAFHRTRAAFERDRARDAALQLAGFRVLRITHNRLLDEPAVICEGVRRLLAAE
jgi:very-short-patch-repair endonuclease